MTKRGPSKLTKENVRAFLDRPWHLFEDARLLDLRERFEADPASAFARSEELWEELQRAGYSAAAVHRKEDFEHHVLLRALIDRARL